MAAGSETIFWVYVLAGLVTLIFTATVVGVIVVAQRRQMEQARRFSQGLVEAQEAERARIARELHDDVIQRVALIGGELSALGRMIPDPSEAVAGRIDGLREELHDLADEVRGMARRAHPSILEHLGLVKALQSLAADLQVSGDLKVTFVFDPADTFDRLPPAAGLALFRVAQEGLRNVVRHAGVREATVLLARVDGGTAVTVEDRGRGVEPGASFGRGLGLHGLTERLRAVQGKLQFESAPGRGTRLVAWVPEEGGTG